MKYAGQYCIKKSPKIEIKNSERGILSGPLSWDASSSRTEPLKKKKTAHICHRGRLIKVNVLVKSRVRR